MEPIHVPSTPRTAFNKNRRMSDLIRAQIQHLKHLEDKLPAQLRQQIPQHPIVTEDDAARYIAPMTRLLRAQGTTSAVPSNLVTPRNAKRPVPIRSPRSLDIAASEKQVKPKTGPESRSRRAASPSRRVEGG